MPFEFSGQLSKPSEIREVWLRNFKKVIKEFDNTLTGTSDAENLEHVRHLMRQKLRACGPWEALNVPGLMQNPLLLQHPQEYISIILRRDDICRAIKLFTEACFEGVTCDYNDEQLTSVNSSKAIDSALSGGGAQSDAVQPPPGLAPKGGHGPVLGGGPVQQSGNKSSEQRRALVLR